MKINKMNYPIVDSHNRITGEKQSYIIELDKQEFEDLHTALIDEHWSASGTAVADLIEYMTKESESA